MRVTEIDLTETAGATTSWAVAAATSIAPVGDMLTNAVVIADAGGRATYANRAWEQVTGQDEAGWRGHGWLDAVAPAQRVAGRRALLADVGAGRAHRAEWDVRTVDGQQRWLKVDAVSKHDADGSLLGFVVTIEDVTAERERLAHLAHRATHDPLTGLYNRTQFIEFVGHAIEGLHRQVHRYAGVIFIDVDNLKATNDQLGHGAGDRLLQEVADCIRTSVRPDDVIARYGGDEFTVLCEGLSEIEGALAVARRVQEVAMATVHEGTPLGLSVGVAVTDGRAPDADGLIAAADDAMYLAKELRSGSPILHGGPVIS